MAEGGIDYRTLAMASTRAAFVNRCDALLLLVGAERLQRPDAPGKTAFFGSKKDLEALSRPPASVELLVRPVKKTQDAFATMITVGRTANNDIALHDARISRFHAFFREVDGRLELGDAGSRHGTMVGAQRLVPKGPTLPVAQGQVIQFADLVFTLCDAGACWDRVHHRA